MGGAPGRLRVQGEQCFLSINGTVLCVCSGVAGRMGGCRPRAKFQSMFLPCSLSLPVTSAPCNCSARSCVPAIHRTRVALLETKAKQLASC